LAVAHRAEFRRCGDGLWREGQVKDGFGFCNALVGHLVNQVLAICQERGLLGPVQLQVTRKAIAKLQEARLIAPA
jgi:hypothetical protein